jgi:hypothetical protein
MEFLAHLEVQIKFTDDLGSVWTMNGYGVDWEVGSFEGPFCGRLGRDHGGKEMFLGMTSRASPVDYIYKVSIIMRAPRACASEGAINAKMLGELNVVLRIIMAGVRNEIEFYLRTQKALHIGRVLFSDMLGGPEALSLPFASCWCGWPRLPAYPVTHSRLRTTQARTIRVEKQRQHYVENNRTASTID